MITVCHTHCLDVADVRLSTASCSRSSCFLPRLTNLSAHDLLRLKASQVAFSSSTVSAVSDSVWSVLLQTLMEEMDFH